MLKVDYEYYTSWSIALTVKSISKTTKFYSKILGMEICSFVPKSSNIEKTSSKGGIISVYFVIQIII